MQLAVGMTFEHERLITRADILAFAELSGDYGEHHVRADGPLMAHGLLVASIVTKIGGDLNYISGNMYVDFKAPVYEGESILGRLTITALQQGRLRNKLAMRCEVFGLNGQLVMSGTSKGVVMKGAVPRRKGRSDARV